MHSMLYICHVGFESTFKSENLSQVMNYFVFILFFLFLLKKFMSTNPRYYYCRYKSGNIILADINRNGTILQKLRGHDEEIHCLCWSPIPGEDLSVNGSESSGIDFNVSNVEFVLLKNNQSCHAYVHIYVKYILNIYVCGPWCSCILL